MKKCIVIIILTLVIYLLVLPLVPFGILQKSGSHKIFITSNEIHTAFFIPKNEETPFDGFINYNDFKFTENLGIEISFGDIDFFEKAPTWDKFSFQIFFDALFIPDKGLMHVDVFDSKSINSIPKKEIYLNDEQFKKFVLLIKKSFVLKNSSPILYKNLSYYQTDRFYLSEEEYFVFNTCNTWTNKILKELNVKTSFFTPHKWGILWHLD